MADGLRLIGAVNAVYGAAQIQRASTERVARTARHEAGQVWLARNHFRRRDPIRPLGLAGYAEQSTPLEAFPTDPDAVSQRPVVALNQVEEAHRSIDHDGAGLFGRAVEHRLNLIGR